MIGEGGALLASAAVNLLAQESLSVYIHCNLFLFSFDMVDYTRIQYIYIVDLLLVVIAQTDYKSASSFN